MGSLADAIAERASKGASRVVRSARGARRVAFEALGSGRYSTPDLGGVDRAVAELLGRDGTFLEVGLGDGIGYSTTHVLERDYGWHGLLVEVIPAGATLSDILDRVRIDRLDLLSLHMPGGDCEGLSALDLTRDAPRYLLLEVWGWEAKRERLESKLLHGRYRPALVLGDCDVLYELSQPIS